MVAAVVRRGQTGPRHWAQKPRAVDWADARADALAALTACGVVADQVTVMDGAPKWYHPGRSGTLRLGPKTILANFGELHPAVLAALDVKGPAVACEVFLGAIPMPRAKAGRTKPALVLSDLPAVERDFAFLVDRAVTADQVVRAARGADKALIARVTPFDVFEGTGVPEGKKSLAIAVRLEPKDATLTDKQIEEVGQKIVAAVSKATGASLRG